MDVALDTRRSAERYKGLWREYNAKWIIDLHSLRNPETPNYRRLADISINHDGLEPKFREWFNTLPSGWRSNIGWDNERVKKRERVILPELYDRVDMSDTLQLVKDLAEFLYSVNP